MAKNDRILLDGIIDERIENNLPSKNRAEVFEYLVLEQLLKFADFTKEEIEAGWVDGRNDGGIDGFYILINGHLLTDPESFNWPKAGSEIEIWVVSCKHHDTFKQSTLDNMAASISELFDFEISSSDLKGDYSEEIIRYRENLKFAYRKLSSRISKFLITFAYASRGDTTDIGDSVISRGNQIQNIAQDSFGKCVSSFKFFGSTELIDLYRKSPNYSLELPFHEVLSRGERYVLLTKLDEFYKFTSDENGKLRRYLFDSNVRDFMGLNRVNEDISNTLANENSPDFWLLNNGVTILATSASVIGKLIKVENIQIVNGLQTTESIFRYFEAGGKDLNERSVLVKIIVTDQEEVRDTIIRATNNQTAVELASLHATDKIQRDVEDVLVNKGIYYERRKNHYINLGHSPSDIVTPLYLASGYVSLILKSPANGSVLKSKFMRNPISYNQVFNEKSNLNVWPVIATILKRTDHVLEEKRQSSGASNEKYLKRWRYILAFLIISKHFGKFTFNVNDLADLEVAAINESVFFDEWDNLLLIASQSFTEKMNNGFLTKQAILRICESYADRYNIDGLSIVEANKHLFASNPLPKVKIDMDFALKVNALLPPQPWKQKVHLIVCQKLNCSSAEYASAVELLIEEGIRNTQKDGVVYDRAGNIISFDAERVCSETLTLINQ